MSQFDAAIVGGGPAGLAATAYLLRAARQSTVLIAQSLGGKVNYPFALRNLPEADQVWGAELTAQLETFVANNLSTVMNENVTQIARADRGFRIEFENHEPIQSRAVIVCTGARSRRTFVEGEKNYWGRGVSFSSISHAQHFTDRDVAVIGDGPRALVAALELASMARHVYLVTPRLHDFESLPSAEYLLKHPAVTVFRHWELQQIVGDEFVTGIQLVGINGEVRQVPVEGVFIQLELLPNNDLVRGLVEMDDGGFIPVDNRCATSVPGLYAAGDLTNVHAELVPVALGEGAKAAVSVWEYLATTE